MHSKNIYTFLISFLLIAALISTAFAIETKDLVSEKDLAKIKEIETVRSIGTLELGGLTGRIEIVFSAPDKIYTVTDLTILKLVQAYDGRTAWMKDQNGQVLELTGMEKKNLITGAYMAGMSYLLDDRMPGQVKYLKDTTVGERAYRLFMVIPEKGDTLGMFFNKHDGRAEIVREKLDDVEIMTFMSDFREVGGIKVPFVSRTESDIPQLNSVITTTEMEFNVPVDPSIFEMTKEAEKDYLFPAGKDSVVVPFELYAGHIYIEAGINGRPVRKFILDSGAGTNAVDKTFAESIGLEPAGELPAKGVAGYGTAALTELDSVSVGGITMYNQVAGIIDIAGIGLQIPGDLGGIMGFDLMQRFPFRLDFKKYSITLYNPETFLPPDSAMGIDFELHMKIPVIQAQYDKAQGRFLVDLGNALGLILHKSFVEKNDLQDTFSDIREMQGGVGGLGGQSDAVAAIGTVFKFGPAEIKKPALMIAGGDGGLMDSRMVDGNIGNLMLRDFLVLMDYKNKKIYILPLL